MPLITLSEPVRRKQKPLVGYGAYQEGTRRQILATLGRHRVQGDVGTYLHPRRVDGVEQLAYVNADLKLTHFCNERRFKTDTPPLHLNTA